MGAGAGITFLPFFFFFFFSFFLLSESEEDAEPTGGGRTLVAGPGGPESECVHGRKQRKRTEKSGAALRVG